MKQIKIFKALEFDYLRMQDEVNRWIRNEQADVVDIQLRVAPQSADASGGSALLGDECSTPSDVFCMVVYNEA